MQRGSHKFDHLMEFSPIYTIINYYYIMLRVHQKTRKIQLLLHYVETAQEKK
jgi:hypothetical protein